MRGYIDNDSIKTILEIGPGNGNFASIMWNDWSPKKVILIDLPETLSTTYTFISSLFPNAKIVLPNEIEGRHIPKDADFILLIPKQIDIIQNDSIDFAINTHSFQEMKHAQIEAYFKLIQRVVRETGYFLLVIELKKFL